MRPKSSDLLFVILAAGLGTRMGGLKPLATWRGKTLIECAIKSCTDTASGDIAMVLGHQEDKVSQVVPKSILRLSNPLYEEGIASSIRTAVTATRANGYRFLLLLCCDQPLITSNDLAALIAAKTGDKPITCARYEDTFGVPAVFEETVFDQLLQLRGDRGAKSIIRAHENQTTFLTMENAAFDVDSPEQLAFVE
jgi:molybdenum cofactor cytidylyltransferase